MNRRKHLKVLTMSGLTLPHVALNPEASHAETTPETAGQRGVELPDNAGLETLAVHAGYAGSPESGAVTQPLMLSTTYERTDDGNYGPYNYTRSANPNRRAVEVKLAALEGGTEAIAFASGMAATMAVFQATLEPGGHIIIPDDCYHGTRSLLEKVFQRWQVQVSEVDMATPATVEAAIRPNTQLIWLETPSNPQLKIADIGAIAALAKRNRSIPVGCDNTWATPFFQRPFTLGVDFVMHSTTKYLGGHSDLLGGCVIVNKPSAVAERIRDYQKTGGAVPSPFDCWLLFRSLSTFPLRMPVHARNALAVAQFLEKQARIERVFYPGLPTHPNHDIARQQMTSGFGGMLAVQVRGNKAEAVRFAANLRIFRHATSLGGVESLIEHRRSAEGQHPKSPDNLLRLSIGIENLADLLIDLKQALS